MTSDDFGGNDAGAELAFERELIASAAADHVSQAAVTAAWSRFAVTLGATATLAGATATRTTPAAELVARSRGTLGWVSLGAFGGGLATAAVFAVLAGSGGQMPHVVAAVPPAASAVVRTTSPNAGTAPAMSATARNVAPNVDTGSAGRLMKRHAERNGAPPAKAPAVHAGTATSLAAEIALLDAARRAREAGEFDRALALLGRYQHEHPHGELRRESEVLKLETLFERGDRDAATRLGRHFLETFPDDPHVSHVRTLAE